MSDDVEHVMVELTDESKITIAKMQEVVMEDRPDPIQGQLIVAELMAWAILVSMVDMPMERASKDECYQRLDDLVVGVKKWIDLNYDACIARGEVLDALAKGLGGGRVQ